MNPYSELGVAVDADQAAVRRAYRHRAKDAHPDHGGDAAAFDRVKRASLVLLDPARRAKYDATGVIEEDAPDNALAEVLVAAAQLLDAAMVGVAQAGTTPSAIDIVAQMRTLAANAKAGVARNRAQIEAHLKLSLVLSGRFKLKHKTEGGNRMAALVEQRIAAQRATIENMKREEAKCDRVIVFLKDYSFDRDYDERMAPRAGGWWTIA